ncbi:MAG: hypothetical protein WCI22_17910, partial [Actinomycetota bacterium]
MLRSRRLALVAATFVLGLSACGDVPSSTKVASSSTISTIRPAVIHLGSGAGKHAPGVAGSDSSMMPVRPMHFVFDGATPSLGTSADAWSMPAVSGVTAADVATMAAALGVKGTVRLVPVASGGGWDVGPTDFTGPTLHVTPDAVGSWWFTQPDSAVGGIFCAHGSAGSAGSAAPTTTVAPAPPCSTAPAPPVGVPDKATALAKATSLLTAMGIDPSGFALDATADQWSASVNGALLLGSQHSDLAMSFYFGGA